MNDDLDPPRDPDLLALFAAPPLPGDDDAVFVARVEAALARARRVRRLRRLLAGAAVFGVALWLAPVAIDASLLLADRAAGWVQSPIGWAVAVFAAWWALRRVRA